MRSHHRFDAILLSDDKLDCFAHTEENIGLDKNGLAFYPRPKLPPWADGSPLSQILKVYNTMLFLEKQLRSS